MTSGIARLAADAADRDIMIGWCTGIILTLLRALAVLGIAISPEPVDAFLAAQVVVQAVLAGALTYGVYRQSVSAAVGLFALWAIGFLYSWAVSARLLPPLGILGILLGYGVYRGIRGTRARQRLLASTRPAV